MWAHRAEQRSGREGRSHCAAVLLPVSVCVGGISPLTHANPFSPSLPLCATHTHTHSRLDRSASAWWSKARTSTRGTAWAAPQPSTPPPRARSRSLCLSFFLCKWVHVCVSVSVRQCVSVLSLFGVSQGHLPIASSAGLRTTLISHSSGGNSEMGGGTTHFVS